MDIQRILYVNIDKDRARRELLERRIRRHLPGVPHERVDAVSLPTLHEHTDFFAGRLRPRDTPVDGVYPYPGTIGCFLSHYRALTRLAEIQRQSADADAAYLVLEDDCVFDHTVFPYVQGRLDSHLPDDWQAVKHSLGRRDRSHLVNRALIDVGRARDLSWEYYWGSHFVIYRGRAVARIAAAMERGTLYCFDRWLRDEVDGVYSFARPVHIKQSNLGGSNTNPAYAGPQHEDASTEFPGGPLVRVRAALANLLTRQSA